LPHDDDDDDDRQANNAEVVSKLKTKVGSVGQGRQPRAVSQNRGGKKKEAKKNIV
jgi:hypothetical protein